MTKNIHQLVAWFKIFKDTEKHDGWSRLVGLLKLIQLSNSVKTPLRFSLTLVTTQTKSHVNCEAIVIKWVKPSLR